MGVERMGKHKAVVWRPTASEYDFAKERKRICSEVNNCRACALKSACKSAFSKKLSNIAREELDAYEKVLNSCSIAQKNYCIGCKLVAKCSTLYDTILNKVVATSYGNFVFQEFEGIQGAWNPCVEGFEEPIADFFTRYKAVAGAKQSYSEYEGKVDLNDDARKSI